MFVEARLELYSAVVMQSPIHFHKLVWLIEPVQKSDSSVPDIIKQYVTILFSFLTTQCYVVSMKHSNKVICVNTDGKIQIKSYLCECILLIIAFHSS